MLPDLVTNALPPSTLPVVTSLVTLTGAQVALTVVAAALAVSAGVLVRSAIGGSLRPRPALRTIVGGSTVPSRHAA
jgi:hypothetical protein